MRHVRAHALGPERSVKLATWTDDFQRADGGIGNNWLGDSSSATISSGRVNMGGGAVIRQSSVSGTGRQECIATIVVATSADITQGPYLKYSPGPNNGYRFRASGTLAAPIWHIERISAGSVAVDTTIAGPSISTGSHTLRALYSGGVIALWWDGMLMASVGDNTHDARSGVGWTAIANSTGWEAVTYLTDESVSFSVSPSVIGNYATSTALTFTGVGTSWTPGTPGSPTITCDHGTLSAQEVVDATTITATYTPGNFLGTVTFVDPSTYATCTATVTSDTTVIVPSGLQLSADALAYIERSAVADSGQPTILNRQTDVSGGSSHTVTSAMWGMYQSTIDQTYTSGGDRGTNNLLLVLWQLLNGSIDPLTGPWQHADGTPISELLGLLNDRWDTLITGNNYTLGDVIVQLAGQGVPTHADIISALGNVAFDDTAILNAIAGVKGDPLATVKAVLDLVYLLGTTSNYTLGDVRTWVEAVRGTNQPTIHDVLDKLSLIQTGNLPDLLTIDQHISTMASVVAAIDLVTAATGGTVSATALVADDILTIVTALQNRPASVGAPVWPGEGAVTFGTPASLANGLTISEPMHGVVVAITGHPPQQGKYMFDTVASWQHAGALLFGDGAGRYERPESIGLESQILTPRTMAIAGEVIVRTYQGFTGTVTPWTIT